MKLEWCPETASKAYIETVGARAEESGVAELVAAMAGGWRPQTIVEAWAPGPEALATTRGLAAAAKHARGRHVIVVQDEPARAAYAAAAPAADVLVGPAEHVMAAIHAVDFVVVDSRRDDAAAVLRAARLGPRGAVIVCLGGGGTAQWRDRLMPGSRVVRAALLPIGPGVEVLHVGVGRGPSLGGCSRWIKHVDRDTGEEHLFRR
ncbi:ankyrin repeat/KH domain protein (DUF1442) [Wolffia australiana]